MKQKFYNSTKKKLIFHQLAEPKTMSGWYINITFMTGRVAVVLFAWAFLRKCDSSAMTTWKEG